MTHTRVGLCVLAALAASQSWGQGDFVSSAELEAAGLAKYWQLQLPLEPGQQVHDAYLVDDHLYLGTQDGYAYAVHAPTGLIRWLRPVTRSGYALRRPCHHGEQTVFVTPSDVQIYEKTTGEPVSRHELDFPPGTAAVSDGERLFIGGLDRRLYALSAETLFRDWRVVTSGPIASLPAIHDARVYVANDSGHVYACTRDNKTLVWQAAAHDRITADLVVTEAGVFAACRDFSLYLFDLNFGNVRWRARLSGPLYDAPVVMPELVYQYSPAEGLAAIEPTAVGVVDKRVRWTLPRGRVALTVHGGLVYVLTADETLVAVEPASGRVRHTVSTAGFSTGLPSPGDSTVFLVAPDGRLFCARPRGTPPLRKEDIFRALNPPPKAEEGAASGSTATTTAPAAPTADDPLQTKRPGMPPGGKSNVTKGFQERGAGR
ncbi:MAG: PQQ-binding-like beta-propeller repeat protein [Planctomycetota bacterium]